jgi:hypothetical protein
MSGREALLAHRARLIARAESERLQLGEAFRVYEKPLKVVDRCLSIIEAIKRSPLLRIGTGIGMAALAFVRPNSIVGWVTGGRVLWKLFSGIGRRRHARQDGGT